MKLAPLQLEAYSLTGMNCQANPQFKADKETIFNQKDLEVAATVDPIKDKPRRWQVSLNIKLQPAPDANSPYSFCLNLVGVVWAAQELPEAMLEGILRTNGPSMLYGVAREMARDLTARGPFPPLMLPSVSFIPDPPAALVSKTQEPSRQAQRALESGTAVGEK